MNRKYMRKRFKKLSYRFYYSRRNQTIVFSICVLLFYLLLSSGYGLLNTTFGISTNMAIRPNKDIRIISVEGPMLNNGGSETSGYQYNHDSFTTTINLPKDNSSVEYILSIQNASNVDKEIKNIYEQTRTDGIKYEILDFNIVEDKIEAGTTKEITIRFTKEEGTSTINFIDEILFLFDDAFIDIVPPVIKYTPEPDGNWGTNNNVSIEATDETELVEFKYCVDTKECEPDIAPTNNKIDLIINEGEYYICAYAKDNAKVAHEVIECRIYKVDRSAPTFEVNGNTTEIALKRNITIIATDSLSGLSSIAYSFDNGISWQSSSSKEITENGEYILKVRDSVGNIEQKTIQVSGLVKPHANITYYNNELGYTDCDTVQCSLDELYGLYGK